MTSPRSSTGETIHPGIALALLDSLRAVDTPDEILEDEAFRHSLPRRLGLSEVIDNQMRRYVTLRERGRGVDAGEFLDLVRLIGRRPDARDVFAAAGRRLADQQFGRKSLRARLVRRWYPDSLRRRLLVRAMRKVARSLAPGSRARCATDPPTLAVSGSLLAGAGDSGAACELFTAAVDVCVRSLWTDEAATAHVSCEGRGQEACTWVAENKVSSGVT